MKEDVNLIDRNTEIDFEDKIVNERDDKLNFVEFSESFSNFLKVLKPPNCVGIFGSWGTGKTSLMNFIKDNLSRDESIIPIWFDSWKYEQYGNILFPLMCEIYSQAPEDKKSNVKEFIENKLLPGIAGLSNLAVKIGSQKLTGESIDIEGFKEIISQKNKFYSDIMENYEDQKRIENEYKKMIDKLLVNGENKKDKKKVVIFIDDLDRCLPEKMIELFESIKNYLTKEDCKVIYVIGVDDKVISSGIKAKYGIIKNFDGYKYLQKIFQFNIHIPKVEIEKLVHHHVRKLNKMVSDERIGNGYIEKIICNVLNKLDFKNPRIIKKTIYRFVFLLLRNRMDMLDPFNKLPEIVKNESFYDYSDILLEYYYVFIFIKEMYPIFFERILERGYEGIEATILYVKQYDRVKNDFNIDKLINSGGFIKREDYKTVFRISQDENYIEEELFRKILSIYFYALESKIAKLSGTTSGLKDKFIRETCKKV